METIKQDTAKQSLRLFFSYGHDRNDAIVNRLRVELERRGHKVWKDTDSIKPGDNWRREILDGVMNSQSIVSFLSEHSTRSQSVCLDELKIAIGVRGANIKTILLEPEDHIKMPIALSEIQWLDMSQWNEMMERGKEEFETWFSEKFNQLCQTLESNEMIVFNGEIDSLKKKLQPYPISGKEHSLLCKDLYGRKWLEEKINKWQERNDTNSLIIYGRPGSGKSAFCVHYSYNYPNVYGCFLCEWDLAHTINPHRLVKTMAFRLATKLQDYRKFLLKTLDDSPRLEEMTPEELFEALLVYPLNNIVDGNRETAIIIIDGLDEAERNDENPIARLFSQCFDKLPRWIKCIFTSRPERDVKDYFAPCEELDIIDDMPVGDNDIMKYLASELKCQLNNSNTRIDTLNRLCELCDGIFLYAVLLADDIKKGVVKLEDIRQIPKGLNAFYRISMERKFPTKESYREARSILEQLCIADNLPEELVLEATQMPRYDCLSLIERLGAWIVRHDEGGLSTIGLSHKSVKDWLVDYLLSGSYYVEQRAGASRLARCCKSKIENGFYDMDSIELKDYIRCHVGKFFIVAHEYGELQMFLLSQTQTLHPYWDVWNQMPAEWNHNQLIEAFWHAAGRDCYLQYHQQQGNTDFLMWIFQLAMKYYGLDSFSRELISIYIDIVHLSGQTAYSVKLTDEYLGKYTQEEILSDASLTMLCVRKLHHSMHYRPMEPLLKESLNLYGILNGRHPEAYHELQYLIGGHLYVHTNRWAEAIQMLEEANEYIEQNELKAFRHSNDRRMIDCMCHCGRHDEALKWLLQLLPPDFNLRNRYEVYMMGSLANIYTCKNCNDEARKCYNIAYSYSLMKGITNWTAHSLLGIANINYKDANYTECIEFAKRASEIYGRINQEWGLLLCDALVEASHCMENGWPLSEALTGPIRRAIAQQYFTQASELEALRSAERNYMELYFI